LLPGLSGVGRADHVALTFDDGPDRESTPAILDALDELDWKATFFCLGEQVEQNPELARELLRRGHEIGAHGFSHHSHLRRPAPWATNDLRRTLSLLTDVTGETPRWFRPPYGALSASSLVAARRCDVQLVLWTTWGRDWRAGIDGTAVAADVERTFYPGATVLLHDSDVTSTPGSWKATLEALDILAEVWEEKGLAVGPLREHGVSGTSPNGW
jgi:peptidoglycan/xylan/chitin deacetylase (PgdA/CDA1 family)